MSLVIAFDFGELLNWFVPTIILILSLTFWVCDLTKFCCPVTMYFGNRPFYWIVTSFPLLWSPCKQQRLYTCRGSILENLMFFMRLQQLSLYWMGPENLMNFLMDLKGSLVPATIQFVWSPPRDCSQGLYLQALWIPPPFLRHCLSLTQVRLSCLFLTDVSVLYIYMLQVWGASKCSFISLLTSACRNFSLYAEVRRKWERTVTVSY